MGLDSTVVETRFIVVRSSVPHRVSTVRKLRDYLPLLKQGEASARGEAPLGATGRTVGLWSRVRSSPAPMTRPA